MTEKPKRTRRKQRDTIAMPDTLQRHHVESVLQWPLGAIKTATSAGQGWTDCVLILVEQIRLGGKYNSRRVRYDGAFYITHNGRNVRLAGMLQLDVFDVVSHVYGACKESDKIHNKALKGY